MGSGSSFSNIGSSSGSVNYVNYEVTCSGHGVCSAGMCYCDEAHEGKGCEQVILSANQCFQDCSSHGLCKQGRCFCAQGYAGVGCEISVGATEALNQGKKKR